jgi:hypothetical protein
MYAYHIQEIITETYISVHAGIDRPIDEERLGSEDSDSNCSRRKRRGSIGKRRQLFLLIKAASQLPSV